MALNTPDKKKALEKIKEKVKNNNEQKSSNPPQTSRSVTQKNARRTSSAKSDKPK